MALRRSTFSRTGIMPDYEKEGVWENEGGSAPIITPIKHSRLQEIAHRLGLLKFKTESSDPSALVSEAVKTPSLNGSSEINGFNNGHAALEETTVIAKPEATRQSVTVEGPAGQGRS